MSLTATFEEERASKVHFSEYIVRSHDDSGDSKPAEPAQPEKPEAE